MLFVTPRLLQRMAVLVLSVFAFAQQASAAEVNGVWTEASTKDLGEWSGVKELEKIKVRGWLESVFVHNFNEPSRTTVNANQGSSIVKVNNDTIEGRVFDTNSDAVRISLAEVEFEKVPTLGEWGGLGFKADVEVGDDPQIIYDTIIGGLGKSLNSNDKWLQHATVGWVAPIGKGLRLDAGKMVTHIGGETIEGIKNNNLSHGLLFTYAIPFQQTGVRLDYVWSDKFVTDFYVLRGWNVTTRDNNSGVTVGPSFGWLPTSWFNFYLNYLAGPEQRNNESNYRHLVDWQALFNTPIPKLNLILFGDIAFEEEAVAGRNAAWNGIGGVARYKLTDDLEPALRLEYFNDRDGFATGVDQKMVEITLSLNYKIALKKGFSLLIRPEYRYDKSSEGFFTKETTFRSEKDQHTVGIGTYLYF